MVACDRVLILSWPSAIGNNTPSGRGRAISPKWVPSKYRGGSSVTPLATHDDANYFTRCNVGTVDPGRPMACTRTPSSYTVKPATYLRVGTYYDENKIVSVNW